MNTVPAPRHQYTYAEYLTIEEASPHKNEYFAGEIYAMAGGTPAHAALAAELTALLRNHLSGKPCRVYSADLRIRAKATGLSTYPDVSVICGPLEPDPEGPNTATNPAVLVEVLSDSTEAYDREEKRQHYQTIASLRDYLLVSQRERKVEHWTRSDTGWSVVTAVPGEMIRVQALDLTLDVRALYEQALD
jgi:Uma2 family endonuclease